MSVEGNNAGPLRVVVSGGISSGKSTAVQVLAGLGAVVIEADRIGHEILEPGGAAYDRVTQRWPDAVVDGRIDRSRLAAIVFSDPEELTALEAISHPLIGAEIARRVAAAGDVDVVLELPLASNLAGTGWTRIVVAAPPEVRLHRAVARGMDRADVLRRIDVQPGDDEWSTGATVVIANTGSIAEFEQEVRRVWAELKASR